MVSYHPPKRFPKKKCKISREYHLLQDVNAEPDAEPDTEAWGFQYSQEIIGCTPTMGNPCIGPPKSGYLWVIIPKNPYRTK